MVWGYTWEEKKEEVVVIRGWDVVFDKILLVYGCYTRIC